MMTDVESTIEALLREIRSALTGAPTDDDLRDIVAIAYARGYKDASIFAREALDECRREMREFAHGETIH